MQTQASGSCHMSCSYSLTRQSLPRPAPLFRPQLAVLSCTYRGVAYVRVDEESTSYASTSYSPLLVVLGFKTSSLPVPWKQLKLCYAAKVMIMMLTRQRRQLSALYYSYLATGYKIVVSWALGLSQIYQHCALGRYGPSRPVLINLRQTSSP